MIKRAYLFSTLSVWLICSGPLFAFYSPRTENTQFLGRDVIQAEVGFEHTEDTDAADYFSNTVSATFSYGLWDKIDILLSAPWQGWNSAGFSESGLGDVALETKFWVAELAVETNTEKDAASHPVSSLLGLVWSPAPTLDLDAGVRLGLNDAADDLGLILGATLRFE